jgi:hypothetical protein
VTRKYDCERTRDFIHEWGRYTTACAKYIDTDPEPIDLWEKDAIERIQKWSDENPEPPKLTAEERAFVAAFKVKESKRIERRHGKVYVVSMYGFQEFEIWPSLFKFIEEGEHVLLTELMKLEVEE